MLDDGIGTAVYERASWTSVHQRVRSRQATGRRMSWCAWIRAVAMPARFHQGHESHDYCELKTKFLPVYITTLGTNITISRSLLLLVFSRCNTSYSLTIDETSRLAIAGLVTSTRVVSYVG